EQRGPLRRAGACATHHVPAGAAEATARAGDPGVTGDGDVDEHAGPTAGLVADAGDAAGGRRDRGASGGQGGLEQRPREDMAEPATGGDPADLSHAGVS